MVFLMGLCHGDSGFESSSVVSQNEASTAVSHINTNARLMSSSVVDDVG
jgi:hypothetical protein